MPKASLPREVIIDAMAKKQEQAGKEGFAERGTRFLRNLHIAIGATALAGAVVFPQIGIFSSVAAFEGVNAVAHEEVRRAFKRRSKPQPKAA